MYDNLPLEMRLMKRWCFTGRDQEPDPRLCKAPHMLVDGYMKPISTVDDYHHCLTFEELEPMLEAYPDRGIGFILVDGDGLTCIDLDVKEDSPISLTERHDMLIEQMDTYTEVSTSGGGVHMWLRGEIDGAIKTTEMEVYSRERFIICTGNILRDKGMVFDQTVIDWFNAHAGKSADYDMVDSAPETMCDEELRIAIDSGDATGKFRALYNGNWSEYTDILSKQRGVEASFNPSDADAAFMAIVTFYTQNHEQCKRMWRSSALGDLSKRYPDERERRRKARNTGTEYKLNRAIAHGLSRNARDKAVRDKAAAQGEAQFEQLKASINEKQAAKIIQEDNELNEPLSPRCLDPDAPSPEFIRNLLRSGKEELGHPPGMAGRLSVYFEMISRKPIREYAILEALATLSGLFGRAYNINGTGVNNFFMAIGPSGSGKSSLSDNPISFFYHFAKKNPSLALASQFITTQKFTHENAMYKLFNEQSSLVQCVSEFGKTFRNMVTSPDGSAITTVREAMTDIYPKSGAKSIVGGVRYTDKEKCVNIDHPVAYSFLGESVAEPFYDSITPEMFADGFMSRFLILQFNGTIPYDSPYSTGHNLPSDVEDYFEDAIMGVLRTLSDPINMQVMPVINSPDSGHWFKQFNRYCTDQVNVNVGNTIECALWNRMNLKVMKIAAVLAVADNYTQPVINLDHIRWAYQFVNQHNNLIRSLINSGIIEVQSDEQKDMLVYSAMRAFITADIDPSKRFYNMDPARALALQDKGVVPLRFIYHKCRRAKIFNRDPAKDAQFLIEKCLNQMGNLGYVRRVPREEALTKYGYGSHAYQLLERLD